MYGTFYLHSFKKDAEERIDILEGCAANRCKSVHEQTSSTQQRFQARYRRGQTREKRRFTLGVRESVLSFRRNPPRQRKRGIGKERRKKRRGSALSDSGRDEKWLALIFRAHGERRSSSFAAVPLRAVTTHRIRLFPSGAQVQPPTTLSDPSLQAFPPANVPFHRRQHADTHIPI